MFCYRNYDLLVEIFAETGIFYGGSDDDDFPTIEEILYTTLQKEGCTMEESSPANIVQGVKEIALEERDSFIDHSRLASSNDLGRSLGERAYHPLL